MRIRRIRQLAVVAFLVLTGQGCATTEPARATHSGDDYHRSVVAAAADVVGAPYRYGGSTPQGFDCSGLVHYAHTRAGIPVPRTTGAQMREALPVSLDLVRPGDVLFFELDGKKISHVGIYAGDGRFIHAPSTGKSVSYARLESAFWSARLIGAGRFEP